MSDITTLIDQNLEKMQVLSQEATLGLEEVNRLEQLATDISGSITGK